MIHDFPCENLNFLYENIDFLHENLRFSWRKLLMNFCMIFLTIHNTKLQFLRGVWVSIQRETRWLGGSFSMVYGQAPEHNGFKLIVLTDLRSDIPDFFEIGHPRFFFFSYFCWDRTRFSASPDRCNPEYRCFTRQFPPDLRSDNEWSPISKKVKKLGGITPNSKTNA